MKQLAAPRGFRDIWVENSRKMKIVYDTFTKIATKYNCYEIKIPTVEYTDLFIRGIGEGTDVVDKEMFTFDYDNDSLCLVPEGTAGTVRALINAGIFKGRYFYYRNFFRKERPQKGRYREFFSIGAEFIGRKDYLEDIECLSLILDFFSAFNMKYTLKINNIGKFEDRIKYVEILSEYLKSNFNDLSETSKYRFNKSKILRILDSKEDDHILKHAPKITDYLNTNSSQSFINIQQFLQNYNIDFVVDPYMVRGLDYYNDLVFEFINEDFGGSQNTICGGGRYDSLFNVLGNQSCAAVGFGIGIDRLLDVINLPSEPSKVIVIINSQNSEKITNRLRCLDYAIEIIPNDDKLIQKAKKYANHIITTFNDEYQVINLSNNEKMTFSESDLINYFKK
jgi:histidyl-tRNA synthetase